MPLDELDECVSEKLIKLVRLQEILSAHGLTSYMGESSPSAVAVLPIANFANPVRAGSLFT